MNNFIFISIFFLQVEFFKVRVVAQNLGQGLSVEAGRICRLRSCPPPPKLKRGKMLELPMESISDIGLLLAVGFCFLPSSAVYKIIKFFFS